MRKIALFFLSLSISLIIFMPSAGAVVLFSQELTVPDSPFRSMLGDQEMSDDFVLNQDSYILDIHWWGDGKSELSSYIFWIRFFEDNAGSPLDTHFAQVTTENLTRSESGAQAGIYYYEADLSSPVFVNAGNTYYVSIVSDMFPGTFVSWSWSTSGAGDQWFRNIGQGISWTPGSPAQNLAFELTGSPVPEPATLLLLGTGLIGLAGIRRKF